MINADRQLVECFQGCLATSARRIDRAIMQIYDEAFRPLGLKSTQVTLLVYVAALINPRPSDLTHPMHIDPSTLSRNLERLLSLGFIEPTEDHDARARRYSLTHEGRAILRKVRPIWERCQTRARDLLTTEFADHLLTRAASLHSA